MRKLKIQEFVIPAKFPKSTPGIKPLLRLQGEWLRKLGFMPGQYVIVENREDKLVISKVREQAAKPMDQ